VRVLVLGTAAGGGLPQWNCACDTCGNARAAGTGRTQDCLAISGDDATWYLVNASPDIRAQILATPQLAPGPGRRQTPLRGALLTSAELDHTLGLASLREATDFTVYTTATVLEALPLRGVIEPYGQMHWEAIGSEPATLRGGLLATAVPLGRKRPRYADNRPDAADWVVAYRFTDSRTGGVLVYAPGLPNWSPACQAAVRDADCVLLDGSFFTDHEMTEQTGAGPTARYMGHLPIRDSLPYRAAYPATRWIYTHVNNTNPALVSGSVADRTVREAGAELAVDGMEIEL
jgi:pyrroloquinoline quinone biosynthesis protein B